jgi:hypothetical protein
MAKVCAFPFGDRAGTLPVINSPKKGCRIPVFSGAFPKPLGETVGEARSRNLKYSIKINMMA